MSKVSGYVCLSLLCFFVLLGGWCVPPKMVEKLLSALKAKTQTEDVLDKK